MMCIDFKIIFYRKDGEKLRMISNRKLGPGSLSFTAFESIKVLLKKCKLSFTNFRSNYIYL
jgi:hypothetical protein